MKKTGKLLLSISLVFFYVVSFSPEVLVMAESTESSSTIGNVEIESDKFDEIKDLIEEEIKLWKDNPIVLSGNGTDISLNPDWFIFDVNSTVERYLLESSKPWYTFWKKDPVIHIPLSVKINQILRNELLKYSHLNQEETISNIKKHAENLSNEPIETVALDLSILESERQAFTLEEMNLNLIDLPEILDALNNQVIPSGQIFSLKEKIQKDNITSNEETIDLVASLLYSVILQTNYEIIERHSQQKIPNYLEAGIEAKVDMNSEKDFKFKNTNETPSILKISLKDNTLLVELFSVPNNIKGEYQVLEKEAVTPRTIYRYSSTMSAGEETLVQEGVPGLKVSVYRTVSDKQGPYESQELVSTDYYPPTHRIIMKAVGVPNASDKDLEVDLNGDGLPDRGNNDVNNTNNQGEQNDIEESENIDSDTLPEGSYYDKAGNIITPK